MTRPVIRARPARSVEGESSGAWAVAALACAVGALLLFFVPIAGVPLAVLALVFASCNRSASFEGVSRAATVVAVLALVFTAFAVGLAVLLASVFGWW